MFHKKQLQGIESGFIKPSMQLPNTMDGKFEETFMDIVNFIERNYRVKAEKKVGP